MNNDLISREALKDEINTWGCNDYDKYDFIEAIDNAPTVAERPQGEWIVSQTMDCHSDIVNVYTCPFCRNKEYSAYPFCHCGADLRGGNKE